MKVAVLTVSDRCSRGEAEDTSGPGLIKLLTEAFGSSLAPEPLYECVEDDQAIITERLRALSDTQACDLVLTTGGTGCSPRDVTPEATEDVLERRVPGLAMAMLVKSLEVTPFAMLSRGVSGIRGRTLIVNLPGSRKGSAECFEIIRPALNHALDLLSGSQAAEKTHSSMSASAAAQQQQQQQHGQSHHRHHHQHHQHHQHQHSSQCHDVQHHAHGGHGAVHQQHQHQHQHHVHQHHHGGGDGHRHHHPQHHEDQKHQSHQHQHHHHHQHRQHPHSHHDALGKHGQEDGVARRARHSPYPMLPMEEAVSIVMDKACRLPAVTLPVALAQGLVLAADVFSRDALPPFPASIKDGYAVIASDGSGERKVVGPVTAGDSPVLEIKAGEVARISTGACLPQGADAVVQVEDTDLVEEADEGRVEVVVRIKSTVSPGHDVRPVGFDIQKGECVLKAGGCLGAAELGLLASIGVTQVEVYRRPVVGVLSTGNELCDPSVDTLPAGHIRDSNRTTLLAALRESDFSVKDLGIAVDDVDTLAEEIRKALDSVDVLITSGGVSMGEKDLLKSVLTERFGGTLHFGRVKMKPGKPTTFVTIPATEQCSEKLVFALPGNPVSALVTYYLFTLPALRQMAGVVSSALPTVLVKLSHDVHLDPRPEYQRCMVRFNAAAAAGSGCVSPYPEVATTGSQCSSRLLSMHSANGLLCLPARTEDVGVLKAGTVISAQIIGRL